MARRARISPDRILAAAAAEFAARGFSGATVDRIARRARVNKAMLYYHFGSKRELYCALLRRMFTIVAGRLHAIAESASAPEQKTDQIIAAVAGAIQEHPAFAAIMLREVADAGAHLDPETLAVLAQIPRAVAGVVQEGIEQGAFRPMNPVFAHFTLIAPVLFYLAATPIRHEITQLHLMKVSAAPDAFVAHMQQATRRALACDQPQKRLPR